MRKLLTFARRPIVWLLALAFVLWLVFLRTVSPPPPTCVVATGQADYDAIIDHDPSGWTVLKGVTDDGSAVTSVVTHAPGKAWWSTANDTHPHVWHTRTGNELTPPRWADVNGKCPPEWQLVWRAELWEHPEGRAFLQDETAWEGLKARFPSFFAGEDTVFRGRWGWTFSFSPDGRLIAYGNTDSREVRPDTGVKVEDARTGRQVAFLPGPCERIHLAPGGLTAVTRIERNREFGELPRLLLWDLQASTVRSELHLPHDPLDVRFTPDGRFVFANCTADMFSDAGKGTQPLRWWDTATGQQVGELNRPEEFAFTAGGRVLITKTAAEMQNGSYHPPRLKFWDVETGEPRGEYVPQLRTQGWDSYRDFVGSGGERYLAVEYDPTRGRGSGWAKDVFQLLTGKSAPEPDQVVVFDTAEKREVMRVPGQRPVLSSNGRWLATIDKEGIIRVWQVPAEKPWTPVLGPAAAFAVLTAGAVVLSIRAARWCWKKWWRRWVFGSPVVLVLVAGGLLLWDDAAADQGDAELDAVRHQLYRGERMNEAELSAMIGHPPTVVPADNGQPGVRHRWSAWGDSAITVHFGGDGKTGSCGSSSGRSLGERIARWLGI